MARRTKQIITTKEYVDPVTNKKETFSVIQQETTGRRNFYILYMSNLMKLFDILGGKKYKIVEFLIDNMNSDQQIVMTTQEIANKTGISKVTVIETLKIMEENNLIVRKTGMVMFNPQLFNKKKQLGEQRLLLTFKEIGYENEQQSTNPSKIDSKAPTSNDSQQECNNTPQATNALKIDSKAPTSDSNTQEGITAQNDKIPLKNDSKGHTGKSKKSNQSKDEIYIFPGQMTLDDYLS